MAKEKSSDLDAKVESPPAPFDLALVALRRPMLTSTASKAAWSLLGVLVLSFTLLSFSGSSSLDVARARWSDNLPSFSRAATLGAAETVAEPRCGVDEEIVLEYGNANIALSRRHEGSRFRLAKVLDKARSGQKIKVAVLGGSVSTGHGAIDGKPFQYDAIEEKWWTFVRSWLFEAFGEEQIQFVDAARPAVDSSFFSWCWTSDVGLDVDLVFVETAVNDEYTDQSLNDAEDLLRSILQLSTDPAVVYVDAFALRTKSGRGGMLNGGDGHAPLSAYYDVPQISLRGPVLPSLLRNKELAEPYFKGDVRHVAAPLHRYLGQMVVAALQDALCATSVILSPPTTSADDAAAPSEWVTRTADWLGKTPRLKISDKWNSNVSYKTAPPVCHLAGRDLEPTSDSPDWKLWSWKDAKHYWLCEKPSAEVSFEVEVREGGEGVVAVSYLRSREYDLGRVTCSVGEQSATVDGHWERGVSIAQTAIIASGIAPGVHTLTCRTMARPQKGRHAFRLIGVLSR